MGGDTDAGDFLDETSQIEFLDLNLWPSGSWTADDAMPQALMFNSSGFCSEAVASGEVWSVGGAYPDWEQLNAVTANRNFGGGYNPEEYPNQVIPSLPYSDEEIARQYVHGIGNCQLGAFNFALGPASQQATGLPGEVITYTLSLTNTGDIPDGYDITVTSNWPTVIASFP